MLKDEAIVLACGIRALRTVHGWTQLDLAERACIGVSVVTALETGTRGPTLQVLTRIAHASNMQISRLLILGEQHYVQSADDYEYEEPDLVDEPWTEEETSDAQ